MKLLHSHISQKQVIPKAEEMILSYNLIKDHQDKSFIVVVKNVIEMLSKSRRKVVSYRQQWKLMLTVLYVSCLSLPEEKYTVLLFCLEENIFIQLRTIQYEPTSFFQNQICHPC